MILVKINPDFESWREKARQLLAFNVHHENVEWVTEEDNFLLGEIWEDKVVTTSLHVPKEFIQLAHTVSAYRDPSTWQLLYRTLYRLIFEDKRLLLNPLDCDVLELNSRFKLVTRDVHKMKAFVRFREVETENGKIYMAWHRPDHRIIRLAAPFFKDRFNGMNWMIMTIDESVSWDGKDLKFSPGVAQEDAPKFDDKEDLWKTYYRSIFNPARIKISAMKKELPVRHWKTLPETELITELINEAPQRLEEFYDAQRISAVAQRRFQDLNELNAGLLKCRACGICERATAPVKGEGPQEAKIMIIGEQPGNEEDLNGRPFIGPAGKVLNEALMKVGLKRQDMYLTNAVKGFKYIPKEHLRWHKGASISEITTCKSWLKEEIKLVKPEVIICLGRSAALSVVGKMVKIEDTRGKYFDSAFGKTIILPHPASILRDKDNQQRAMDDFIRDWKNLREKL